MNESCIEYTECKVFSPFIDSGKAVLHIEYPPGAGTTVSTKQKSISCATPAGFSTLLKKYDLDSWTMTC